MIEIDDVTKRYDGTEVVSRVSLTIPAHSIAVIVGTSGSGKTTLLRMINRLVEPTAGSIRIDGEDTRSLPTYCYAAGSAMRFRATGCSRIARWHRILLPCRHFWDGTGRASRRVWRSC